MITPLTAWAAAARLRYLRGRHGYVYAYGRRMSGAAYLITTAADIWTLWVVCQLLGV